MLFRRLAVVASARNAVNLETVVAESISCISIWMEQRKLQLTLHKTDTVMLAVGRKIPRPQFRVHDNYVTPMQAIRYLGVYIDENIRMVGHVKRTIIKAEGTVKVLARIMPNTGGTLMVKRRTQMHAAYSVMLYGVPICMKHYDIRNIKS